MIVRRLQDNGDIATSGVTFINGRDAVAQTICTRLRLFLGEYFLNSNDGTPWFQEILGKYESLERVESILRNRISRTEGVQRIISFQTTFDDRTLSVHSEVLTVYGDIELNEVFSRS